jgi:hypothetical protein
MKTFLLWLLFAMLIAIMLASSYWTQYFYLSRHGVFTYGVVTAKEPKNHQVVRYTYNVAGKDYSGEGRAGYRTPTFDKLNVGDQVLVAYDQTDPQESCLGDPQLLLKGESFAIIGASVIGSMLIVVSIYAYTRSKKKISESPSDSGRVKQA